MPSITAIELGADTCAFARTAVRGGEVSVSAAELLDPAGFPGAAAFTSAVRKCRLALRLPRRCRVVLWGLPDGASPKDTAVKPLIDPLTSAGFRVERVVSPCNALAALARVKTARGDGATCWVAINRGGVAIVVVRPGTQVYSHSFPWDSTVGASGSQARLLQRYSLVSFLSPEVKRAMAEARASGTPVTAVVTCGNLADLRSLTMPLIEELDVEVETLDSLEGLVVKPGATERLTEVAAAIRLACAGAIARETRPRDDSKRVAASVTHAVIRGAALVIALILVGGAYAAFEWWWDSRSKPSSPVASPQRRVPPGTSSSARPRPLPNPRGVPPPPAGSRGAAPPVTTPLATSAPPPVTAPPATSTKSPATAPVTSTKPPVTAPPVTKTAPPVTTPSVRSTKPAAVPTAPKPNPPAAAATPSVPPGKTPPPTAGPPQRNSGPTAQAPSAVTTAVPATTPPLLADPLPRVTAILVSHERRFATVNDGQVVGVGDAVGRRQIVAIDERALTLREPSGVQIRVGLGGRFLGVARVR